MSNKVFINCDEATRICTKNQYGEASFWEKIKLNIHLISCKICGLYSKQNTKLTEVCNKHLKKQECDHELSKEDKKLIKENLSKADR